MTLALGRGRWINGAADPADCQSKTITDQYRMNDDLGDRIDCRLPNQEADDAVLGIRGGDPDTDFATAGAKADASADADQAGEILLDVGFAFDRQAAVAPEAGPDAADDWNGRQALEFQMGGKSLFRRYNHGSFLLQGDGRHDG
ncbi:hypothetical protein [Pleomorphomonas carboxyditropha]|uniref:hypothetical protein n=1 Tax=Pleomorphomonas carboxyditropha TaxID=2023338 RepID=UPI0010543EC1|nr:hypothetical protein [Pleomorphomonas carboxyditropha]